VSVERYRRIRGSVSTLTHAPQHIANQMKGYTSHELRAKFPVLKSRLPSLWSRSYYVGSAGAVSAAAIQKYIEAQKES
jgi:putative transposase